MGSRLCDPDVDVVVPGGEMTRWTLVPCACSTYPDTTCYTTACQVVDIRDVWRHQRGALPNASLARGGGRGASRRRGLARLVHLALRCDLDKVGARGTGVVGTCAITSHV